MGVKNGLTGFLAGVEQKLEVAIGLFLANLTHQTQDRFHRLLILRKLNDVFGVHLRNHQDVYVCLWVDIPKGYSALILTNPITGNLVCDDFAKNTIGQFAS